MLRFPLKVFLIFLFLSPAYFSFIHLLLNGFILHTHKEIASFLSQLKDHMLAVFVSWMSTFSINARIQKTASEFKLKMRRRKVEIVC
jgi:hypothetical protein